MTFWLIGVHSTDMVAVEAVLVEREVMVKVVKVVTWLNKRKSRWAPAAGASFEGKFMEEAISASLVVSGICWRLKLWGRSHSEWYLNFMEMWRVSLTLGWLAIYIYFFFDRESSGIIIFYPSFRKSARRALSGDFF